MTEINLFTCNECFHRKVSNAFVNIVIHKMCACRKKLRIFLNKELLSLSVAFHSSYCYALISNLPLRASAIFMKSSQLAITQFNKANALSSAVYKRGKYSNKSSRYLWHNTLKL